jgi:hypothetical protein
MGFGAAQTMRPDRVFPDHKSKLSVQALRGGNADAIGCQRGGKVRPCRRAASFLT